MGGPERVLRQRHPSKSNVLYSDDNDYALAYVILCIVSVHFLATRLFPGSTRPPDLETVSDLLRPVFQNLINLLHDLGSQLFDNV